MRRRFAARLVAALAVTASLAGCSTNPVTGEREFVLMSPAQEQAAGAQAAEQVRQEIGLIEDSELVGYVRAIGNRLAGASPRQDVQYQFYVADMAEPNAFALPGGYIYVSRGLLAIANSESELACVIGHEIGHVAARHSAQRQTRATGVGILTVLGTVLAGAKGGAQAAETASRIGQVAGAGLIASYSRDQERQSDEIGQQLAAQSGWDPRGMAEFMDQLGAYTVLTTGSARQPTWLDSHPPTDERVQTASARATDLSIAPMPGIAANKAAFYAYFDGLLVGADPAAGLFRDNLFLHPTLDFAAVFPPGWDTQNQPSAVLAAPADRDALLELTLVGPTGDPRAAAIAFARENNLTLLRSASLQVNGLAAFQALAEVQSAQGNVGLHLTWIAHPAGMFRITGSAPVARFSAHAAAFGQTAGSLRTLTDAEQAGVTELHLDVVTARGGETIDALSRRTGNRWSPQETSLANDLPLDVRLAAGQPIKIAVEVPFRP